VQAAYYFAEAQPQISNLLNGKLSRFSADKIIIRLAQTGRHVRVQVTPRQRGVLYYARGSRVNFSLAVYRKPIYVVNRLGK
jgi:hypothetical protein